MLRIVQSTSRARAKSYFSTADYYSEGQELLGEWRGQGAAMLGLSGPIQKHEWDALCDNLRPDNGRPLTVRSRTERRVGWDFTFDVPKGVSLLYGLTRDERILHAFRESVHGTMQEMELEAATRVRRRGADEDRVTSNLVWGEYVHRTSRPVEGVPDPQLHAHCFVFNATYDREERRWKAAQIGAIKRDAPYWQAAFDTTFARRLQELGLETARTRTSWDLKALSKPTLDKFSRRTAQIEGVAKELGITDPEAKSQLGASTRERKAKELGMSELAALWRDRLTAQELATVHGLSSAVGTEPVLPDAGAVTQAVDRSLRHVFERSSVVPERTLLAEALRQAVGTASRAAIETAVQSRPLIHGTMDGRAMVTIQEVLTEERAMLKAARDGRGACQPIAPTRKRFNREWLNADQKAAVRHVLSSKDRILLIRGVAGAGKTTMLQETKEAIEHEGFRVFAFAPSTGASRGVLRDEGFPDADTVQRLLIDRDLQADIAGQPSVAFIDEAGFVGTKTMRALFDLAQATGSRMVLVGDVRQHGSVERGSALQLLEEEAGLQPAEIKEIQRQSGRYKAAMKDLSDGKMAKGFAKLDRMGWIHEVDGEHGEKSLAQAYVESVKAGRSTLIVSPTHAEGDRITRAVREALKAQGLVSSESRVVPQLVPTQWTLGQKQDAVNYELGDALVFHQNARGYAKGQVVTVASDAPVPINQAERYEVFRRREMELAAGDRLRITRGGGTKDGRHRLNNGDLFTVKGFTPSGDLLVFNDGTRKNATKEHPWVIAHDYGHIAHGLVVTSHASQGKTVDCVLIGQSAMEFGGGSQQQFYVSASRGRQQVRVFTDSKEDLLAAIQRQDSRVSATELVRGASGKRDMNAARRRAVRRYYDELHRDRVIHHRPTRAIAGRTMKEVELER